MHHYAASQARPFSKKFTAEISPCRLFAYAKIISFAHARMYLLCKSPLPKSI